MVTLPCLSASCSDDVLLVTKLATLSVFRSAGGDTVTTMSLVRSGPMVVRATAPHTLVTYATRVTGPPAGPPDGRKKPRSALLDSSDDVNGFSTPLATYAKRYVKGRS